MTEIDLPPYEQEDGLQRRSRTFLQEALRAFVIALHGGERLSPEYQKKLRSSKRVVLSTSRWGKDASEQGTAVPMPDLRKWAVAFEFEGSRGGVVYCDRIRVYDSETPCLERWINKD